MPSRKGRKAGERAGGRAHKGTADRALLGDLLQKLHDASLRIDRPHDAFSHPAGPGAGAAPAAPGPGGPGQSGPAAADGAGRSVERDATDRLIADLATCLWYLKTKHFRLAWDDETSAADEPRERRALGRLNKGIDALRAGGVEVVDPTNRRYPQGGDALMRPLQFLPTAGLTYDRVTETVTPVVFRHDRLVQRGEVFVAVPDAGGGSGPPETRDDV